MSDIHYRWRHRWRTVYKLSSHWGGVRITSAEMNKDFWKLIQFDWTWIQWVLMVICEHQIRNILIRNSGAVEASGDSQWTVSVYTDWHSWNPVPCRLAGGARVTSGPATLGTIHVVGITNYSWLHQTSCLAEFLFAAICYLFSWERAFNCTACIVKFTSQP